MSVLAPPVGSLTDRVQLQRREMTPETEGGHSVLYVPIASLWARVRSLPARQSFIADGRGAELSHSVVLRFRSDVKVGDRFVYRGRALEVRGTADLDGRRAWLSCQCAETAASG